MSGLHQGYTQEPHGVDPLNSLATYCQQGVMLCTGLSEVYDHFLGLVTVQEEVVFVALQYQLLNLHPLSCLIAFCDETCGVISKLDVVAAKTGCVVMSQGGLRTGGSGCIPEVNLCSMRWSLMCGY